MARSSFSIKLDRGASKRAIELLTHFPKKMQKATDIALFRISNEVRNDAAEKAPYKTGTLRRSLTSNNAQGSIHRKKKNYVEVGTNLVYALAHEFGYKSISAKKYMTKAFKKQTQGRAARIFSQEINNEM